MKRILAIFLAVFMLLALAACGKDDGGGKLGDRNDNSTPSGQTDTSTPGNTDNPGNDNTPTEDKVEIKGNSVIQTSVLGGGAGYQTVEYAFDGDVLKKITLTSVSTTAVDQNTFDALKDSLAGQGYSDVKLDGKTITAVCTDIPNSGYTLFANMGKENLKNALEGNVSGGDVVADYRIQWEDIQFIPTGMPKLADKVSEDYSDSGAKSCSVTWNVLPKADMEAMKGKLETWVGGTLEDMGMPGTISYMLSNDKVMIMIMYSEEPMAGMAQCTVTVNDMSF